MCLRLSRCRVSRAKEDQLMAVMSADRAQEPLRCWNDLADGVLGARR